jgi:starvation-inducible outer membrane lipoprotein
MLTCPPVNRSRSYVRNGQDRELKNGEHYKDLTFTDAKRAPEQHRGKIFLLGGTVDDRTDLPDMTRMRIHQHPVDTRYRPHVLASSEGEFLVVIRPPVDPAQYSKGKRFTMVGKLTGVEPAMGGGQTEPLPSFEALFLRSWEPPVRSKDQSFDPNYLESSPGNLGGIGYGPYPYSYP